MPIDSPAERRLAQEQPRVRPSLWAVMLIVGGIAVLWLGHKQEWFLGALATGKLHSLTYYLAWAGVGVAYSILATLAWSCLTPGAGRRKVLLAFLASSTIFVAGSQTAARQVMSHLTLAIDRVTWDRRSKEFVVHIMSTPAIASAQGRGNLSALVLLESPQRIWTELPSGQRVSRRSVTEFVGSEELMDQSERSKTVHLARSRLVKFGVVRVPWPFKPYNVRASTITRATAALANKEGKRISPISNFRPRLIPHLAD